MSEEVRQATPPDEEMSEYWERVPGRDNELRGIEAWTGEVLQGRWQAGLAVRSDR